MYEVFNAPIACIIMVGIMIAIVEFKIKSRKREIEEWEARYEYHASEDQE